MRQIDPEIAPKALNDLGHLASAVGHHVINAYSAIVSNAELLRIKLAPGAAPIDPASLADTIIDTAMEAAGVARRLIDFTRPITTIGEERLRLDELVAEYILAAAGREEFAGIAWSSHLDPVPAIRGQAGHLGSMLDFLVANAREAMSATSTGPSGIPFEGERQVTLSTSLDGRGWVMLEVRDTGRGMEPEVLERAVEPFFSTKNGHLGVGLSIANGIWRRHRGTLSLQSKPGEGTTLRLCVEP